MLPKLKQNKTRTKYWIYPYGFSNTALSLVQGLNGRLIRREGSLYGYRTGDVVLNWGCSVRPVVLGGALVVNRPEQVRVATSKLATFRQLEASGVATLKWTCDPNAAKQFKEKIVARDKDRGAQGEGITVYKRGEDITKSHLFFTEYYRKEREFRIHVFNGQVIFQQEKLKKNGVGDDYDKYVRSHGRGWCFAFHHLTGNPVPEVVRSLAIQAVHALTLDFGAVDIGWNSKSEPVVFEVNTAPGLEETSLAKYCEVIKCL